MSESNLYRLIANRFPVDSTQPLIVTPNRVYSWSDMDQISAHFADILTTLGCIKGDRVAVQVDKSPEALFLYLACLRAGFVFLPINTAYHAEEVDYLIGDAAPVVVIASPDVIDVVKAIASRHGSRYCLTLAIDGGGSFPMVVPTLSFVLQSHTQDDVAAILYTSGTTGRPKGAMLSHRNLIANGEALRMSWAFTAEDILLHALPIFHVHGLFIACHCVLLSGARMIWLPVFNCAQLIEKLPEATVFMGVPTHYTRLLASSSFTSSDCTHMRLFISGSAPLQLETFTAFQQRTGHTILERYGMTETGVNTSNQCHGLRRPGNVGWPLPGTLVRVVGIMDATPLGRSQVGMLQVRGDNVFVGYWRRTAQTVENFTDDGWFITGDLARIEKDGSVTLVGRNSDVIISGGYNIYPQEVERVIDTLEGVIESAVIGLPHSDFGEAVVAVAVKAGGLLSLPTAGDIIQHVRNHLADYKIPKAVLFVDALPRNILGKTEKHSLQEKYATLFTS